MATTLNPNGITMGSSTMTVDTRSSAPSYPSRAWCTFNGAVTNPIAIGSGNISSITDHGVGQYTVNLTTGTYDSYYSITCSAGSNTASYRVVSIDQVQRSSTANRIATTDVNGNLVDCSRVCVSIISNI